MPDAINFPCPLCGLLCDDLSVISGQLDSKNCALAAKYFAPANPNAENWGDELDGQAMPHDQAVSEAAKWLRQAKNPVIIGPAADHAGLQQALRLADRVGAVVDGRSPAQKANMRALQRWGGIAASFNEIANRADVIWLMGGDFAAWPRLAERLWQNKHSLYRPAPPNLFHWRVTDEKMTGKNGGDMSHNLTPKTNQIAPDALLSGLSFFLAQLQAKTQARDWRPLTPHAADFVGIDCAGLLASLQSAKYAAIIWDAASFPAAQAEMAVGLITLILRALNVTGHAVGLPLGGGENSTGWAHIATWQTGYPLNVFLSPHGAESDPFLYDGSRLGTSGEADLLVWLDGFGLAKDPPALSPKTKIIAVLGHPAHSDDFSQAEARLTLRVGRPGYHHGGDVARADSSLSMPLNALYENAKFPSVAGLLLEIEESL
ncbi:MAG: hypothetical protein ORN98_08275 [Alphaproteobacteria bacterium]|nr:hypothetical protein [Alphaproteobacteria bacterium]